MKFKVPAVKLDAAKDALVSGASASVLSAAMLALCSKLETNHAASALNGPSQWIWGEHEARTRRATFKHTLVGYAIHHASSIFWALFYEHWFGRGRERDLAKVSPLRILAEAGATTTIAYYADYCVAPTRLRPGFKKHIGPASMFASYAAFAAGLALTTLVRKSRRTSSF